MAKLVDLIVGKYDGSLKAEHGTGINMAPYVEREWGERATELMWRVSGSPIPTATSTWVRSGSARSTASRCSWTATPSTRRMSSSRSTGSSRTPTSRGPVESGLLKMIAIGLGKQRGADTFHGQGFATFAELIPAVAAFTLAQASRSRSGWRSSRTATRGSVAIEAVPAAAMYEREQELRDEADAYLARLPIAAARRPDHRSHRQGHQRPRDGLERRRPVLHRPTGRPPLIQRIVVRDLTDETEGNAVGIGMADVVLRRRRRADGPGEDLHELHHREDARGRPDRADGRHRPRGDRRRHRVLPQGRRRSGRGSPASWTRSTSSGSCQRSRCSRSSSRRGPATSSGPVAPIGFDDEGRFTDALPG